MRKMTRWFVHSSNYACCRREKHNGVSGAKARRSQVGNYRCYPCRAATLVNGSQSLSVPWVQLVLLLLLCHVEMTVSVSSPLRNHEGDPSSWYKRYPSYPPYCSTPGEMSKRGIPHLADRSSSSSRKPLDTQLVQVNAIIRHGSRTPYSADIQCWDGYWSDPQTGVWDCDLTTMTAPPPPPIVRREEDEGDNAAIDTTSNSGEDAMFLFEKHFDALPYPPFLTNALNGTCQVGQLLLRGYEQEYANGRHLRNAYVYDGTNQQHHAASDTRMRLFDLTTVTTANASTPYYYQEPNLYYRVDDEQRTLMSGQVLLRGLFGQDFVQHSKLHGEDPVIPLHTADRPYDVLAPNPKICPRLHDLQQEALSSEAYKQFNTSYEARVLRHMMTRELGADFTDEAVDCLMTTMCTDRQLPDILNDYNATIASSVHDGDGDSQEGFSSSSSDSSDDDGDEHGYGSNIFQRVLDFSIQQYSFHMRYNDAAHSKLAMGPMWAEIMSNIHPLINDNFVSDYSTRPEAYRPPPKLALYSGHDTTIMPLLATLGEEVWDGTVWPPYASIMVIEIHKFVGGSPDPTTYPSDFAFRLVYNGQSLTSKMDHCPDDVDLCDISILINRVKPFATVQRDCSSQPSFSDEKQTTSSSMRDTI